MDFADFKLLSVTFTLNKDFKVNEKTVSYEPEIAIDYVVEKKKKEIVVLLGVRKIEGNIPYYFEVRAGGLFKFDKLPTNKLLKQFAKINCPAIIFPYLRETIADLTRRAGFPPLHLDPINFIELSKEVDKLKKTENKKSASE